MRWREVTPKFHMALIGASSRIVIRLRYFEQAEPSGWEAHVRVVRSGDMLPPVWPMLELGHIPLEEAKRIAEAQYFLSNERS